MVFYVNMLIFFLIPVNRSRPNFFDTAWPFRIPTDELRTNTSVLISCAKPIEYTKNELSNMKYYHHNILYTLCVWHYMAHSRLQSWVFMKCYQNYNRLECVELLFSAVNGKSIVGYSYSSFIQIFQRAPYHLFT